MQNILNWFTQSAATDVATALVYLAIAGLFVVCLLRCVAPVWQSKNILRRAASRVRRRDSKADAVWQDEEFLGKGHLLPHWSEYLNNLFFADGAYHNPSSMEDFINEDTVIYGPGRVALSEAAPGLMVSLGFLGTLIGISQGLKGFSMDNISEVTSAITRLIPNMQYAFNTSIVGVVSSILFTIINKSAQGGARRAMLAFYADMNKYAGVTSVDPMTQIAIYQQEQTTLLQNLSADLNDQLSADVAKAVERAMMPLSDSMTNFMTAATREQLRGVDAIVQRFLDRMDEALQGQFTTLAGTLGSVSRGQKDLQMSMTSSVESLRTLTSSLSQAQRVSESLLSGFSGYVKRLEDVSRTADTAYLRMSSNAEHQENVAVQQSQYMQTAAKLQSELSQTVETMRGTMEKLLASFDENVAKQTKALSDAEKGMRDAGDTMARSGKALVDGVAHDVDNTYNEFFAKINEASERLNWMVEDVRATVEKLPEVLDGAAEMYSGQAQRMTAALREAQHSLEELTDRLSR